MRSYIFWLFIIAGVFYGCKPNTQSESDLKKLEKVIVGIEKRRAIEIRKINEQEREIKQLKENKANVNSDGMREKISREIVLKESVIERSRSNKMNQTKILEELYHKRDSIKTQIELHAND